MWRLNGVKRFITNGCADVLLVLARSEEGSTDARGLSLFEVEADETVRIRRIENKMGLHASPTCEIQFNNTPARLIGKRRFGLIRYAMAMMNGARLAVAAQAVGIAEAAYREAYRYAQQARPVRPVHRPDPGRLPHAALDARRDRGDAGAGLRDGALGGPEKGLRAPARSRASSSSESRKRLKQADRLAAVLTPLAKYYATEMGNRVCYQAHAGPRRHRLYARVQRRAPLPRHPRDQHLRGHQPAPGRGRHRRAAGPRAGRPAGRVGRPGLWPGAGRAQGPGGGGHRAAQPLHRPPEGARRPRADRLLRRPTWPTWRSTSSPAG